MISNVPDGYVAIAYDWIGASTDSARLFIIEEKNYWIPNSQIYEIFEDDERQVIISRWIAEKKQLI